MTPVCIDLQERFGARYRLRREADGATWYDTPEDERVWLLELPCRYGVIYPHGGEILAAVVTGRYARQQVAALPCIRSRRGDAELVITFSVEDAEQVLAILKPRRRRQLSPEDRARKATQLARINQERRIATSKAGGNGPRSDAGGENAKRCVPKPSDAGNGPDAALGGERTQ